MKKINISPPRQLVKLAVAVLALGVGLLWSSSALAVSTLNFTADTTVYLSTQAINLVIQNGSGANSVIVGTNTLTVTVPAGSTFVVRNTDKRTLSNDQSIATNCTGSYSELSMGAPSGTVTVVITPASSGTCTVTPPSGGGGGGGGGGPTTTSTGPTSTSVVIASGAAQATSASVTLTLAATSATQMAISNSADFSAVSWETYATSKAWTLTSGDGVKTVYAKFRDASGNVSAAVSDTITLNTSGTATVTPPPATTPETPASTPQAPASEDERAKQIETIVTEASEVSTKSAEALAEAVGKGRDTGLEQRYESTIVAKVVVSSTPAATKAQVLNFVTYGTPTTLILGAGERAGVVNSFRSAFGKVPASDSDWADVIKIANGRFPGTLNATQEKAMETTFKKIYLRLPSRSQANDNAAITVMAYGLRTATRNLNSEKAAIKSFKTIFAKAPTSASDWDAVRAIAYSGAKR